MTKEEFYNEIDVKTVEKKYDGDYEKYVDRAYNVYKEKLEPNLELITSWRLDNEDAPTLDVLRHVLKIPYTLWDIYKKMPTVRFYLNIDKNLMSLKAQKDLLDAIRDTKQDKKYIAKLYEMQMIRYDEKYGKRKEGKEDTKTPDRINIVFTDGGLDDDEILEKSGKKDIEE